MPALSAPRDFANASPTPLAVEADLLIDDHFRKLAAQIEQQTGIRLPAAKKSMVEGRLRVRARIRGLGSLAEYGQFLFSGGGLAAEFADIVDCVTTNKTDFFREGEHFDILCNRLVPDLLAQNRSRRSLKVWSAAASSGAEAYTIAMVLADLQPKLSCDVEILATDISGEILEKARRAIYTSDMLAPIPNTFRQRYIMMAKQPDRQEFRIVPELRRRVQFRQLNLMATNYDVARDQDVIFCRNVLIYFDKKVQRTTVERLVSHLRPGGYLLLGHSEAMLGSDQAGLRQVSPTVFQSTGDA